MQPIAGKPGSHRDSTMVEMCAVDVGAWLAGDGPQSGPNHYQFCSATLDLPWRVSISPIKRLASAG